MAPVTTLIQHPLHLRRNCPIFLGVSHPFDWSGVGEHLVGTTLAIATKSMCQCSSNTLAGALRAHASGTGVAKTASNAHGACYVCKCWRRQASPPKHCARKERDIPPSIGEPGGGGRTYTRDVPGPLEQLGRATPEPTIEGLADVGGCVAESV